MEKIWISGNKLIECNTNQEIIDELYGSNSIHAKYTQRINWINKQLKKQIESGELSKPGRPRKQKPEPEDEQGMAM